MRLRDLFEAPQQRTAVMAFGRMNPPTIGHAKLVDAVKSQGGDPYIFLSQSQKPKTDPLAFADKLSYAKFFFPEVTIGNPEVKTIIQALQKINALGYDNLVYVAGSDRVASFEELINKYNGKEYNFKSISVVSAGERDPDADGAEGMSASKMRAAAAANDLNLFKQGVPNQEVADEMFAAVRKGMGVRDEVPVAAEDATTPKKAFIEEKLKTVKFKIAQSEARVAQLEAMLQKAQQA
jgi:nicotinic acid mononucleotide adenylyltransferase